ncbi:hypothetical protein BCR44DRAFT_31769 [Catenaria anguillulae PL171]|uniref:Uncharacterized protein n=1 Tax=Catenaria anguillulae PL171 TaxID=765915 RepID=A0A1Y2HDP0_9FUNG|nr:hypothetical protein BCR44DRAFT_31769 [Catenaria anguillulae PL171]
MLSSNANTSSPHSAQPNATTLAPSLSRTSDLAMDPPALFSSPMSAKQSLGSRPFPNALATPNSDASADDSDNDNDNDDSDDNNSDHVDDERYRTFRVPSPIALRTGPKSGMLRNFGFDDDAPLPTASTSDPVSASAARDARHLGYGVELGLEFPDIPRIGATSRPSRVDSAWTTASKSHLPHDQQPLPTVVDDPLASFAIPILSHATPKSAFAPSPLHPTTHGTNHHASNVKHTNDNISTPTNDRLAQLRAAILDVSADQARDHLRSRQLFSQHRSHINLLVQRLFTAHETDPYFVARSLALLAKFDSPYKRQRVLLTLDAMDQEMTKEEERELLGLDADDDMGDSQMGHVEAVEQPTMVKENSYLHSLRAASSAVKDSLHMHHSPPHAQVHAQMRQSPPKVMSPLSSSSVSDSGHHRGRRGRPSNKKNTDSQRVEPHRVRASIGSTIPLFPTSTLASVTAKPRSTTSISPPSSPFNTREPRRGQVARRGRGEDDDSTATCTSVSSSSRSDDDSDQDRQQGDDANEGDQVLDLNSLLLVATTADTTSGGTTAMIRDQLTKERQRLLFEQEQLRLMLAELQNDVAVMERVASLQAQREADQMQLLGSDQSHPDQEDQADKGGVDGGMAACQGESSDPDCSKEDKGEAVAADTQVSNE